MGRGDLEYGSIPNLVRVAAERHGDRQAVKELEPDGLSYTYADLAVAADRAARAFVATGVEPGDRIAIWSPNLPEWVVALVGLQAAGAVLVPLNTRYKGTETEYILTKTRARVLVTVNGFLGNEYVDMLDRGGLPDLERIVVMRGDVPEGAESWERFLAGGDHLSGGEVERRIDALGPDSVSDIIFTSGTTGLPKGVVATHGQTLRIFSDWAELVGLRADDRYLLVNPMFHTFGYKAGVVASIITGTTLLPLPVFDVDRVLDAVPAEGVTMIPGPPTLYQSLLNHPRLAETDVSSLRLAVTGAATIPVDLVRRMRDELGFQTVVTAYGLTEATGCATACRADDDIETIAGTSGRAFPDVEVRVVDDAGADVPCGQPGEVVVRGYNVMRGYYDDPEQTAETIDAGGWLHTGDIGVMDEAGNLRITDRKKDMFIVGGFNAYPAEIENLLTGYGRFAQVAVVGVPDDRLGEVGVAFVVPKAGEAGAAGAAGAVIDEDAVISWARQNMANYKVPRRVIVVESLPLNASGKVLKYELREQAAAVR